MKTCTRRLSTESHAADMDVPEKPSESSHEYLAKDGNYYKTYMEMVRANVETNHQHLKDIGLVQVVGAVQQVNDLNKKSTRRRPCVPQTCNSSDPPAVLRRSSRKCSCQPENSGLTDDVEEHLTVVKRKVKRQIRVKARRVPSGDSVADPALTDEQRKTLARLPDWIGEMESYLLSEESLSLQNFRSVMRQVEKLVTGVGITYTHWDQGVAFGRGVKVDLSHDFDQLYDLAVEFENEHGKDLGNGTLQSGRNGGAIRTCRAHPGLTFATR